MIKKRLIVFVALVCVLLGLGSVEAASFIFSAEQTSQETCPTVFTMYQFTVTNTGDETDSYTVSKSGSAAAWALISPPGFVLLPGDSQAIYVYVTPSSSAQTGSYSLDLSVTADKAGTQKSTVSLIVGECHSISISPQQTSQEICTGDATSYSFSVQNTGFWSENIRLSLAGSAAQWSSLSEEFLRLEADESRTVAISVNPKANEIGDFDLSVTARSLESNALANQDFKLKIKGCYGIGLSAAETFASFCENSEVKVPLTLENTGTAQNVYDLEISGAEWSALDRQQISLESGAKATFNAVLFPEYGVKGKFPFKITAVSQYGGESDSVDLTANVMKCHDVGVSISESEDKICPSTAKMYSAEVANSGTKTEQFVLSLDAPSWVRLDKTSITLNEGQSETISIFAEPPADATAARYSVTVEASSMEASSVSDKDSIALEISPSSSCFGVRTTAESEYIKVAYGEGTLVPIVVENVGSETEAFSLDVSGNGAAFAQLNPSSVEIEGNSAETVYLYVAVPKKTEKTSYSVTVSARDEAGVVSSSSTIYVSLTDEPTAEPEPEKPEIAGFASGVWSKIKGSPSMITGFVSGAELPDELPRNLDEAKELAYTYRYWIISGIAVVAVLIILAVFLLGEEKKPRKQKPKKKGLWQRFTDWLEEDVEEIEIIDTFKPKPKKKKGIWQRFTDWIEEEDEELAELYRGTGREIKPKPVAKPKKKEKGLWDKFSDWLEEDELPRKPEPRKPQPKPAIKPKPKRKEKGLWQKFSDWLEEEEEEEPRKKPAPLIKPKPKPKLLAKPKKEKGLWGRFSDWLEEDEEPVKRTVQVTGGKQKKKPEKKKQKPKNKGKSSWDNFKDWLEEE